MTAPVSVRAIWDRIKRASKAESAEERAVDLTLEEMAALQDSVAQQRNAAFAFTSPSAEHEARRKADPSWRGTLDGVDIHVRADAGAGR